MSASTSTLSSTPQTSGYLGLAALLRLNFSGQDLAPLCQSLIARAEIDPEDSDALMDAAVIFQFRGQPDVALKLQEEALKVRRHYRLPARGEARLRVLALMVPGEIMANVPIECLVENSDIQLDIYYVTEVPRDLSDIPDHDVLFVAIGESVANRPFLAGWQPLLAAWPRPVVNNPFRLGRVARDAAAGLLKDIPGVAMPSTLRMTRSELLQLAERGAPEGGLNFPLIVRPQDSHAGHDLYKADGAEQLLQRLSSMAAEGIFVSPFVDYRSPDGLFRKYRVVLIDGRPFACHMAISSHWMIHYLNAGMADSAEKRAEEARFMGDFETGFAVRHGPSLAEINRRIGLDYLGIDCAETPDGRLLIFEVDPAMVVHALDPVDVFPYKPPAMEKLFAAFRAMLIRSAESGALAC